MRDRVDFFNYTTYKTIRRIVKGELMKHNKPPALGRRERKKRATHLTIIKVAMGLFKQQGFQQTSMEQIAEQSDVSKATLYKYFAVKEAIIAAYWQEEIKNSQDELRQIIHDHADTRSRLEAAYRSFMSRIMQSSELYEIYISYRMQHITHPEINEKLRCACVRSRHGICYVTTLVGFVDRIILYSSFVPCNADFWISV